MANDESREVDKDRRLKTGTLSDTKSGKVWKVLWVLIRILIWSGRLENVSKTETDDDPSNRFFVSAGRKECSGGGQGKSSRRATKRYPFPPKTRFVWKHRSRERISIKNSTIVECSVYPGAQYEYCSFRDSVRHIPSVTASLFSAVQLNGAFNGRFRAEKDFLSFFLRTDHRANPPRPCTSVAV